MHALLLTLILSPLVGSALNGLVVRPKSARIAGFIATLAALLSFACALILWTSVRASGGVPVEWSTEWMDVGSFQANWGFRFDALTSVMALIVAGIGSVIHLYSIGYMSEDPSPARYFAYLNLFLFNMLLLISGDNLVVLFVGWEGVGLCSYLLIGFWYEDLEKANAGMKAFVVNRIGDACFLIGGFLLFTLFGTLHFSSIAEAIANTQPDLYLLSLAALFLFLGATGKSAQIPLYTWLPDAMAGPTPVSALIHAATMVTAGVYLVCRMSFVYEVTPIVDHFIVVIGAGTALFAALIATSQRDIKKILAYSTVSQLGFMFVAAGLGAYTIAIFHVMTHAFFKALLFLGAGSVIHGLHGEQDIFAMGGLRKKMPYTFWTFTIGWAAISGFPFLSGFFSKDAIIHAALSTERGSVILWMVMLLSSILTAFYMGRMWLLTFFGKYRGEAHPHESPAIMWVPLAILAVGSATAGFLGVPHASILEHFLSCGHGEAACRNPILPALLEQGTFIGEVGGMILATVIFVIGTAIARQFYYPDPSAATHMASRLIGLKTVFANKFWVDELYDLVFVRPFRSLSGFLATTVDQRIIDGLVLLPSKLTRMSSTALSFIQMGAVQFYLWIMVMGVLLILWTSLTGLVI